jgi:four helix bundle protein
MKNKDFGQYLETRTKDYAIEIVKLSSSLSNSIEDRVIRNQIIKSGTSIGANYREANKSRSKADFKHKICICQSETNETLYWLELILELKGNFSPRVKLPTKETKELLALFTSIVNKVNKQ